MKKYAYIPFVLVLILTYSCSKVNPNIGLEKQHSSQDDIKSNIKDTVIENLTKANLNVIDRKKTLIIPDEFLEFEKNSSGFCLVKGNPNEKQSALTFDDGPTEVSTQIINLLNSYNAKATFFWVGEKLKHNKNTINLALQSGHLIANHSWDQKNGTTFSNDFLWKTQVNKCLNELAENDIKNSEYYRPPFGAITQDQIDFLASKNIKTVLWSITTSDWDRTKNTEGLMFNKFKKELHNGAIVLMHDFDFGNLDAKLADLEKMLKYGQQNGYQFVTIENL